MTFGLIWACGTSGPSDPLAIGTGGGGAGSTGASGGGGSAGSAGSIIIRPGDGGRPDSGASINGPVCSEQVHAAQPAPLDLLLLVDASSSMLQAATGSGTKHALVRDALAAFVRDPGSTGLGVGLQFFPLPMETECTSDADCGPYGASGKREWWGCHNPMVCAPPRAPLGTSVNICAPASAQADCLRATTSCVPLGYCSVTGWACTTLGDVCQSGSAGDTCMRYPRVCNGAPICNPAMFSKLAVPIADLPGAAAALEFELRVRESAGSTPMEPAVEASLSNLAERAMANPGRAAALVLATDGLPEGCANVIDSIASIARRLTAAAAGRPAVTTYVIGVIDKNDLSQAGAEQALGQLARAGATGAPFLLTPTADLTQTFLAALEQIRSRALPCEFIIPKSDVPMLDFGLVNLRFHGSGGERDIFYVATADRCDPTLGGWYYDVDPATGASPSRVVTCPATCAALKSDTQGSSIDLRFGCRTIVK